MVSIRSNADSDGGGWERRLADTCDGDDTRRLVDADRTVGRRTAHGCERTTAEGSDMRGIGSAYRLVVGEVDGSGGIKTQHGIGLIDNERGHAHGAVVNALAHHHRVGIAGIDIIEIHHTIAIGIVEHQRGITFLHGESRGLGRTVVGLGRNGSNGEVARRREDDRTGTVPAADGSGGTHLLGTDGEMNTVAVARHEALVGNKTEGGGLIGRTGIVGLNQDRYLTDGLRRQKHIARTSCSKGYYVAQVAGNRGRTVGSREVDELTTVNLHFLNGDTRTLEGIGCDTQLHHLMRHEQGGTSGTALGDGTVFGIHQVAALIVGIGRLVTSHRKGCSSGSSSRIVGIGLHRSTSTYREIGRRCGGCERDTLTAGGGSKLVVGIARSPIGLDTHHDTLAGIETNDTGCGTRESAASTGTDREINRHAVVAVTCARTYFVSDSIDRTCHKHTGERQHGKKTDGSYYSLHHIS